ncbi:MAG TPA: hypothetical protein VKA83_01520 [Methylomirabilota bacterium]|nr:hypothetical protein [Methylomirabilota bacterium]
MLNLVIGFLNDVIIVGGTALTTAMLATKTVEMPSGPVILVALIMGLIQAARRLDSKMAPSPMKDDTPPVRTEAELMAQVKTREAAVTAAVEAIRRTLDRAPVTPQRVEPAAPASPGPSPFQVP